MTGRAKYGADFYTAGLLLGKILRSPHAHAIIKSIDTSSAEAHRGVKAVMTAQELKPAEVGTIVDLGESTVDVKYLRGDILARDKALYEGPAVAAVAANSPHEAEEALSLIDVDYEVLPPVLTVMEAMNKDAPLLHEDLTTEEGGGKADVHSNVVEHFQHIQGAGTSPVHLGLSAPPTGALAWRLPLSGARAFGSSLRRCEVARFETPRTQGHETWKASPCRTR